VLLQNYIPTRYLSSYLFCTCLSNGLNTGIKDILQISSNNQDIPKILWNLGFQESNWSNPMIFLQDNYNTFIFIHVQVNSLICVLVPKPVDIYLFSPTCATYTDHFIQLYSVQCNSWSYILRCYFCELFSHTSTHIWICKRLLTVKITLII
jgi:putative component of membrane protein insertase Oxa1/YidC/SpoIIIJ protein YidD